jgi:hypothetical protein
MLVTPRVIDDLGQWDSVLDDFRQALIYLELGSQKRRPLVKPEV